MADQPTPQQHATFPGDVRHMATNLEVVGPNRLGEYLVAVSASYDPVWGPTGRTRVGFAYKSEFDRLDAAEAASPQ